MSVMNNRGFFGIGIYQGKDELNYGTLLRSANILGASFVFLIGKRFKHQCSDTMKTFRHVPLYEYQTFKEFMDHGVPRCARLIGVEITDNAISLENYPEHPEQAVYLLGAEDGGLPNYVIDNCHDIVSIPGNHCLNVSVAGSIVMYDRILKQSNKGI